MPDLSAGVNCSFEDYVETEGRIQGAHIFCLSPSVRDIIPITRNKGRDRRGDEVIGVVRSLGGSSECAGCGLQSFRDVFQECSHEHFLCWYSISFDMFYVYVISVSLPLPCDYL